MGKFPLVSIIVTTKNEEKHIAKCLKSIVKQSYPKNRIEIIVIDNNSVDKTTYIAKQYTNKVFTFGPERSAQRNFGMKQKSKGKYLIYLDADMTISKSLVKKAVLKLEKENLGALYLTERIIGKGFWIKVRDFERQFYQGTVIDAVRIIKKDVFLKSGGFDESLTGPEDWDLDKKIRQVAKTALLKEKNSFISHHEGSFNLFRYLKKKSYYINDFKKYIKKWGKTDPDIKRQFSPYYRMIGIFINNKKWLKTNNNLLLFFGLIVLRFLTGLVYLKKLFFNK